jgi:hypothetical protein
MNVHCSLLHGQPLHPCRQSETSMSGSIDASQSESASGASSAASQRASILRAYRAVIDPPPEQSGPGGSPFRVPGQQPGTCQRPSMRAMLRNYRQPRGKSFREVKRPPHRQEISIREGCITLAS